MCGLPKIGALLQMAVPTVSGVPRGIFSVYIYSHGEVAMEWEFEEERQHGVCL